MGVLVENTDDTPAAESPSGGPTGEDFGGIMDTRSTDRTEAVATEESQLTPPINSMIPTRIMMSRNPKAASGPWKRGGMRSFIVFWRLATMTRIEPSQRKGSFWSQNETLRLQSGTLSGENCRKGFDVFGGHDKPKAQVLTLGKERVADCKGSGESVFRCVHGLRLQRDSTQVNERKQKGERKLKGGMPKVSKIQKPEILANGLGVGHAMSKGGRRRLGDPKSPFLPNRKKQPSVLRILGCQKTGLLCCAGFPVGTLLDGVNI